MASQFDDNNRLIAALCKQEIIGCNKEAAAAIAKVVKRKQYLPNKVIINQDDDTNDMYFILSGEVEIQVNKRPKAIRKSGQQIGEMALVKIGNPRSATVLTKTKVELAKVTEKDFTKIANAHPDLWRNIAESLADRLFQRNFLERSKNEIAHVFLASSSEGKKTMKDICDCLNVGKKKLNLH